MNCASYDPTAEASELDNRRVVVHCCCLCFVSVLVTQTRVFFFFFFFFCFFFYVKRSYVTKN